ncbi:FTR1 family protein [Peptoniphilus sp. oral taxon 386]|uniref:FTR1 family iron permease n=1 Tax=Peptoniphilus sp. oral taxon 386 TaxID=652713 RepID=UPI0001DA9A8A|nr:FTR1 family protein [Peptoniphilus sp. oral taxon 386]EFI41956.1 iron permease FTR1 family [Peptoniphilus sp. oral taxon 386 str. F0131]
MKKNLLKINVVCFLLIMVFMFGSITDVNAETKYENWVQVADAMSEHLNNAVDIYEKGGDTAAKDAIDSINIAYFKFYEKIGFEKTVMSRISGKRGSDVEHQFYLAKKSIKGGSSLDEVKEEIDTLITMLHEDAHELDGTTGSESDTGSETIAGFNTFISVLGLTLREGLEAILVVAAIAAYLVKTNNKNYLKSVYMGAVLGIIFSVILAVMFNVIADKLGESTSGVGQEVFEGIAMFVAVIVLFYVSNWMLSKSEVEVWNQYIKTKVEQSITKGNMITLAFTAFLAVAREGAELILFFQGMRSNISNNPSYMWGGLAVAVAVLAVVYYAIAKLSVRLPLKPFFTATSWLMFILCISFIGKGVFELQEAGVIGRTIITAMNGFTIELLGVYDRVETLVPQIILLVVTIISVIYQNKNNRKKRAELEAAQNKQS